jgi:hypothetical protein
MACGGCDLFKLREDYLEFFPKNEAVNNEDGVSTLSSICLKVSLATVY